MNRCLLSLLVMGALFGPPAEAQERTRQPGEHSVTVSGVRSPAGDGFSLKVEYDGGASPGIYQAVLVRAEPSGTLLLAQHSPNARFRTKARSEFAGALASINAPLDHTRHAVFLPYDPLVMGDSRITVTLIKNGESLLLADGVVGLEDFSFTSYFRPEHLGKPTIGLKGFDFEQQSCPGNMVEHCCSGGSGCPRQCVCCHGPSFFCNLITCEPPECLDA